MEKMKNSIQWTVVFLLSLFQTGFSENGSKVKIAVKRSYQLPQVTVVNDRPGLQYYAAGPLYTIPTVLIPNQIGLSATPITNLVLPSESKLQQEFQETSTPAYTNQKPAKISTQFYKQKHRSYGFAQTSKRPTSYVNSVYGHPLRTKPLPSIASHKMKVSSLSIQPSVDLSGQYSQEASTNLYSSTVGPPVASTYGPPKAVDFQYKTRLAGINGQSVYHKLKGPSHRQIYHPSKKLRVYSHVHKDHIHNHYIPSTHPLPIYKTQHPPKYLGPLYLPPAPSTPPTYIQETTPTYSYQTNTQVKFPDNQETIQSSVKDQSEVHKPNYSPGGVTQAIIKNPGIIKNYDANIPLHVPSKKPYQFEVNEILKNSELHFVQEAPEKNNNEQISGQNGLLHYSQKVPYQNPIVFGSQQLYTPLTVDQSNIMVPNNLDIYTLPGLHTYQTNHIVGDQDLGTSETVKVPVAIIRGAHNIASQGMFGFTVKRQDDSPIVAEEIKKAFTPSKRTSDWIPMSGNGVPIVSKDTVLEKQSSDSQETIGDGYYPTSVTQTLRKEIKTIRPPVGDIISGKIPQKYFPKTGRQGDIVNGKISFTRNSSETEKRKGSVIDVYPSATSARDTSDLVVSSVIKFS